MSADPSESGASQGDDLFDLPSEAPETRQLAPAQSSAASMDVEKPASALPRRTPSTSAAGPLLTNVESSSAGVQEQIRTRPSTAAPAAPPVAATTPKIRKITSRTAMWIAFGALALVNGGVLGFIVVQDRGTPSKTGEHTTSSNPLMEAKHDATSAALPDGEHATQDEHALSAQHSSPPAAKSESKPPVPDVDLLEAANAALKAARDDMASGRRGTARGRLARVGLAIDAIQPSARTAVRAETALLLAQCIQADADEAARIK